MFLGLGTSIFGTSDGLHVSGAGRVGFHVPAGGEGGLYARLHQVRWRADMLRRRNLGGHLTSTAPDYIARYVAPLVRADTWDKKLVENIADQSL
jgi:hypothetical protein